MSENNKTYRIRTDIGDKLKVDYITLDTNILQDYDTFDILSLKIDSVDTYKLHNANYGVVVGRVLANNGFGIPNAKISIFIEADSEDGLKVNDLYPFTSTFSKDRKGVRYNLLPNEKVSDCHQVVGTFPNKRYALDNDAVLEVFDKYYKYTTRTNNSGDYLIMGVPVGNHTLHMDLDLSDCGILSQRPRDFVYKGYTIEQFENPNMFKDGTIYSELSQIFTQDQVVNIQPFWGNASTGEKIGITRADINVAFKFEPTCVFMGSVISDNSSQGISKKCIPTENMGNMEELVTGEGTIEMIRKTPSGAIEEFQIKGNQLINGDGIWCYQIPMNLDYVTMDEYGNIVPTDDVNRGIPTRTCVRFRISMQDNEENVDNYFRSKMLVPHNPQILDNGGSEPYDYEFGSKTSDESFRDLFWNNVYSVKSYVPRFQKRKVGGWKEKKFSGIKNCNFFAGNNPIPYNNIRIKLPFMFTVMCAIIKILIFIISIINTIISSLGNVLASIGNIGFFKGRGWRILGIDPWYPFLGVYEKACDLSMNVLKEGLCPDLENWNFAPMFRGVPWTSAPKPEPSKRQYNLMSQTLEKLRSDSDDDKTSVDYINNEEKDSGEEPLCLTIHTDYLLSCVEMNLAMEYKVINFDFYNDWLNGTIYFPRFMRYVRPKKTFLGITFLRTKIKGCMDDTSIFSKTRRYTQQCSMGFKSKNIGGYDAYVDGINPSIEKIRIVSANNYHKQSGINQKTIFGENGGICHEHQTMAKQNVYYMKPCEWTSSGNKVILYASDIILLGSLNDCDQNGVPKTFKYLSSTSYIMPTNLALTNMETNGALYATDGGTFCAGSMVTTDTRVSTVDPNKGGLSAELKSYANSKDPNYNTQYDGKELSDIIALTEAAGISWNYTGPGQGVMDASKFYFPGGHFLGLSCVNSQTNFKSCLNLKRICEVGSNMSQRKEDVSSINSKGEVTYTYTAPSGFISGDDIVGEDFRSMFATLNQRKLKATKINPFTGYKMYDFEYVRPINFDGSYKNVIAYSPSYNGPVTVPKEDTSIWEKMGIDFNSDSRPDYDANETANTQTRTIEDTSIDYYRFRMGLNYKDLKKSNKKHQRKFLLSDISGKMYLPQYENSYYFYFGLKNGSTALDELNKQFFSECENGKLMAGGPTVNIFANGDLNVCEGYVEINVDTNNLTLPFQSIEVSSDVNFLGNKNYLLVKNGDEYEGNSDNVDYDYWLTSKAFSLGKDGEPWKCPFGTYTVTVRDANDTLCTKTVKLGTDILSYDSVSYDFNTSNINEKSIKHRGGYITVSDLKIDGLEENLELKVFISGVSDSTVYFKNGEEGATKMIEAPKAGEYKLCVSYKCPNASKTVTMLMKTFTLKDNLDIKLMMGQGDINKEMTLADFPYGWWTDSTLSADNKWIQRVSTFNIVQPEKRLTDTSRIKVYAEGGTKVVWGCPQSAENGIKKDKVWCSEKPEEWEEGYTIDDEYVHYPTYKYNGSEITQFSALVYKGQMVMGDYCAKMVNGSVSNVGTNNPLKKGCGYIFKPIPDGDLQFHVYNGSYTANTYVNDETITDGVFYPSISYPSMDRPFFAKTNFYCWARNDVWAEILNDGTIEVYERFITDNGKTEMKVVNGVTYGNSYYTKEGGSVATNLDKCDFKVTQNDLYGLKDGKYRITTYSGYNSSVIISKNSKNESYISVGDSSMTNYSYTIIDGASDETDISLSNSISDSLTPNFANNVSYGVLEDGSIAVTTDDENSNSDVEYFMACLKTSSPLFIKSRTKYLCCLLGKQTLYVFCRYTSESLYDIENARVIVKITLVGPSIFNSFVVNEKMEVLHTPLFGYNISYNKKNEKGEIVTYSEDIKENDTVKTVTIEQFLDEIFAKKKDIKGDIDYKMNSSLGDWEDVINKNKLTKSHKYNKNNIYYAVGKYTSKNTVTIDGNTTPATTVYKIYPYPDINLDLKEADWDTIMINNTSGETVMSINNGTSNITTFTINASTTQTWNSFSEQPWITVDPSTGKEKNMMVNIIVESNNTGVKREGIVKFYYESLGKDSSETWIKVVQESISNETTEG